MNVRQYSLLCSQKLLKDISSAKYTDALGWDNSTLVALSDIHLPTFDVDIKWQLISTALLMSEGLFKNNKTYDFITPKITSELEQALCTSGYTSENRPLDKYNKPVYDFASFLLGDELEPNELEINDASVNLQEDDSELYWDDYLTQRDNERTSAINANSSCITEKGIDIIAFIKRVRNALAHSNYEIMNNNCIRLFHYNHESKKLDFNVVVNQDIVIPIIDILNEIVYKKYEECSENISYDDYSFSEYYGPINCDDKLLIDFILSFEVCNEMIAQRILEEAQKMPLYNTPTFDEEQNEYTNENKLKAICMAIDNYIKPLCDYGIIINDLLYTDNGLIVSDKFYDKYDLYSYLKGDFYSSTYALPNDTDYIENELRLKILSLLNSLLLTVNNEVNNNNLEKLIVDFSAMDIPEEIILLFEEKQKKRNTQLIESVKENFSKTSGLISDLEARITKKKQLLKDNYRDLDYYNAVLPQEIIRHETELQNLKQQKVIQAKLYLELDVDLLAYNYEDNLAVYILNSLRNSLAHGNVMFDDNYEDVGDMKITFEDYNPENQSELTFKGRISLNELIKTLLCDNHLDVLKR